MAPASKVEKKEKADPINKKVLKGLIAAKKTFSQIKEEMKLTDNDDTRLRNAIIKVSYNTDLPAVEGMKIKMGGDTWTVGEKTLAIPIGQFPEAWRGYRKATGKFEKDDKTGKNVEITEWIGKKCKGQISEDGKSFTITLVE